MEEQQPHRLHMYTKATRIKQVIRHIFPNVPFPIPVTISGFILGGLFFMILTFFNIFDVFTRVFVFIATTSLLSYFEPENIHPLAWIYAVIRRKLRPIRRVGNRAVPKIGWRTEYHQQTIVHYRKEDLHDSSLTK